MAPTPARATLHHSPAKTTSSLALTCPSGEPRAEPKGGSLAAPSSAHVPLPAECCHIGTGQEPTWAPTASWATWLLLGASGEATQLPCPLSSCGTKGVASQTKCCTDFVLLSLSGVAWSLSGIGLGMARSLYWILIVLLSGVGEKSIFKSSCGCITLKGGG